MHIGSKSCTDTIAIRPRQSAPSQYIAPAQFPNSLTRPTRPVNCLQMIEYDNLSGKTRLANSLLQNSRLYVIERIIVYNTQAPNARL